MNQASLAPVNQQYTELLQNITQEYQKLKNILTTNDIPPEIR